MQSTLDKLIGQMRVRFENRQDQDDRKTIEFLTTRKLCLTLAVWALGRIKTYTMMI